MKKIHIVCLSLLLSAASLAESRQWNDDDLTIVSHVSLAGNTKLIESPIAEGDTIDDCVRRTCWNAHLQRITVSNALVGIVEDACREAMKDFPIAEPAPMSQYPTWRDEHVAHLDGVFQDFSLGDRSHVLYVGPLPDVANEALHSVGVAEPIVTSFPTSLAEETTVDAAIWHVARNQVEDAEAVVDTVCGAMATADGHHPVHVLIPDLLYPDTFSQSDVPSWDGCGLARIPGLWLRAPTASHSPSTYRLTCRRDNDDVAGLGLHRYAEANLLHLKAVCEKNQTPPAVRPVGPLVSSITGHELTDAYLFESKYTNHAVVFDALFKAAPLSSLIEFGLGEGTKYFLDHLERVTSVELLAPHHKLDWFKECKNLLAGYGNADWVLSVMTAPIPIATANAVAHEFSDPVRHGRRPATNTSADDPDPSYLLYVEQILRTAAPPGAFDVVFIDMGVLVRGDFVNAALAYELAPVIACHDWLGGSPVMYQWDKVKVHHPSYHLTVADVGEGLALWIRKDVPWAAAAVQALRPFAPSS